MSYERLSSETLFDGLFFEVRRERVRYEDGSEHEREFAWHPGAVAILPHDGERLFMVRQPRESVAEQDLLELPAGKLDVDGESPLECAGRELREEVGVSASRWSEIKRIYTSPGFTSEEVHIFEATGLEWIGPQPTEGERIEIVSFPLAEIGAAIEACLDATSLVGLLLFRERLAT